jgi:hypothetical protein
MRLMRILVIAGSDWLNILTHGPGMYRERSAAIERPVNIRSQLAPAQSRDLASIMAQPSLSVLNSDFDGSADARSDADVPGTLKALRLLIQLV